MMTAIVVVEASTRQLTETMDGCVMLLPSMSCISLANGWNGWPGSGLKSSSSLSQVFLSSRALPLCHSRTRACPHRPHQVKVYHSLPNQTKPPGFPRVAHRPPAPGHAIWDPITPCCAVPRCAEPCRAVVAFVSYRSPSPSIASRSPSGSAPPPPSPSSLPAPD